MRRVLAVAAFSLLTVGLIADHGLALSCQKEVQELCKDVTGGANLMKCLHSNEAKLSDECKAYLAFFEKIPSCVADADKFCPKDVPSGAEVIICLRGRKSDLSPECQNELREVR
jgi:hypothetical protein